MEKKRSLWLMILIAVALGGLVAMQFHWVWRSYHASEKLADLNLSSAIENTVNELSHAQLKSIMVKDTVINGIVIKDSLSEQHFVLNKDKQTFNISSHVLRRKEVWSPDSVKEKEEIKVLVNKVVSELSHNPLPLESRIKADEFKKAIVKNLTKAGIDYPVEYGVYEPSGRLALHTTDFDSIAAKKETGRPVFRGDILWNPVMLKVQTPGRAAYLWKNMTGSIAVSFFIVFFISLGIAFVLKQYGIMRKTLRVKSEFISNISHELKTPVATMELCIRTLEVVGTDAEKTKHITHIMEEETQRLKRHIDRMLEMTLLERSELILQPQVINVDELLQRACNGMQYLLGAADGKYASVEIEPNIAVFADPYHLENVIRNLIDNAIRYARNGVPPEIKIRVFTANDKVNFEVEDNGRGVAQGEEEKIFEPFYRVDKGNLHQTKGTGLGLAYCRSVADRSNGKIYVAESSNYGTTIRLELPIFYGPEK